MVELKYDKTSSYAKKTFNALYKGIGIVNDAIEKTEVSKSLTAAQKADLLPVPSSHVAYSTHGLLCYGVRYPFA